VFWSRVAGGLNEIVPAVSKWLALAFCWSILWFDPRREHSSVPTANPAAAERRDCQGWPRLRGHPLGLGLDWPEHGGMLDGLVQAAGIYTVVRGNTLAPRTHHSAARSEGARGGPCQRDQAFFCSPVRRRRLSPLSSMRWAL
jgi:hypothetical protein